MFIARKPVPGSRTTRASPPWLSPCHPLVCWSCRFSTPEPLMPSHCSTCCPSAWPRSPSACSAGSLQPLAPTWRSGVSPWFRARARSASRGGLPVVPPCFSWAVCWVGPPTRSPGASHQKLAHERQRLTAEEQTRRYREGIELSDSILQHVERRRAHLAVGAATSRQTAGSPHGPSQLCCVHPSINLVYT